MTDASPLSVVRTVADLRARGVRIEEYEAVETEEGTGS